MLSLCIDDAAAIKYSRAAHNSVERLIDENAPSRYDKARKKPHVFCLGSGTGVRVATSLESSSVHLSYEYRPADQHLPIYVVHAGINARSPATDPYGLLPGLPKPLTKLLTFEIWSVEPN